MARQIWTNKELLNSIKVIQESEEDNYSEVPGWEGEYMATTPDAILLYIPSHRGRPVKEVWFPKSQLRLSEDRLSMYAANWLIEAKGLI